MYNYETQHKQCDFHERENPFYSLLWKNFSSYSFSWITHTHTTISCITCRTLTETKWFNLKDKHLRTYWKKIYVHRWKVALKTHTKQCIKMTCYFYSRFKLPEFVRCHILMCRRNRRYRHRNIMRRGITWSFYMQFKSVNVSYRSEIRFIGIYHTRTHTHILVKRIWLTRWMLIEIKQVKGILMNDRHVVVVSNYMTSYLSSVHLNTN